MQIVMFYHSLISDWNHGNAHFLRGVVSELLEQGHEVEVFEPRSAWGLANLLDQYGKESIRQFNKAYPKLNSTRYSPETLDLDFALDNADLVIVHEWNDPQLVQRIGKHRRRNGSYKLLFHDTHHRAITRPAAMREYDLSEYDGALVFGEVLREAYQKHGWARRAWTWHEAADTRLFKPYEHTGKVGDLVWIGNWGDGERSAEVNEFLLKPVKALGLKARTHGVRYPVELHPSLDSMGLERLGWLPNYRVPQAFAQFKATIHLPRRPFVNALPGVPTIRMFEALACGIPLISAPWRDDEELFTAGEDYLVARNGKEMQCHLHTVLNEPARARALAKHGRKTILENHTCEHRVDELMSIYKELHFPSSSTLDEEMALVGDESDDYRRW